MEYVTLLSRLAMNVASDAHVYSVLKLVTTVQQAELLKQTYQDMPPEVEASYSRLTEAYAELMTTIPQRVSAKLLEELERTPELNGGSLLSRLRALFGE